MKVGIMSDSHGRVRAVREAIERLEAAGAERFVHCGDVGGVEVLEEFAGRTLKFVWGNTDLPDPSWRAELKALGLDWPSSPNEFTWDGFEFAVFHGHERGFEPAVRGGLYEYILHGHTHQRASQRVGPTHVINPGALYRAARRTVALLDTQEDQVTFLPIDGH